MLLRNLLAGSVLVLAGPSIPAGAQTPQIEKKWELGHTLNDQLLPLVERIERRDYRFWDTAYLQRLATGLGKSYEIRVTAGTEWYAFLLPDEVAYLSGGLIERVTSEAELAGLLAHEFAHKQGGDGFQQCVLASGYLPVRHGAEARAAEKQALRSAAASLQLVGFDPSAVVDLFSKLRYEHPLWSKAIAVADLLELRAELEREAVPAPGYSIDSSAFARFRASIMREMPPHTK